MSTNESTRLKGLAAKMVKKEEAPVSVGDGGAKLVAALEETLVANAPHGEKSDHVKVTVTLPPRVYELLMEEVTRRKVAKGKNGPPQLSAIIREAVVGYIGHK